MRMSMNILLAEEYFDESTNRLEEIVGCMADYRKIKEDNGILAVYTREGELEVYMRPENFFDFFHKKVRYGDYQLQSMGDTDFPFRLIVKYQDIRFKTLLKKNQWQDYLLESEVLD